MPMLLHDYLSVDTHQRRILLVSDLVRGQALIRRFETDTGKLAENVSVMLLQQAAEKIWLAGCSAASFLPEQTLISPDQATVLFRNVVLQNLSSLYYFNSEKIMDLATSAEVFRMVNLIREDGWSGEEEKRENARIRDLKFLTAAYEEKLSEEKLIDATGLLKQALSDLKTGLVPEAELSAVLGPDFAFLQEDGDGLTGLQKEFLQSLHAQTVRLFPEKLTMDSAVQALGQPDFYQGFGSFNEASYVANDILEKQLSFGNVVLYFTSAAQLPSITSALSGNGIPMRIASSHPALSDPLISLAKRILNWAADDFSEKALEGILASPVLYLSQAAADGTERNLLAGSNYFDHVLSAENRRENGFLLGWGYERNRRFLEHERKLLSNLKLQSGQETTDDMEAQETQGVQGSPDSPEDQAARRKADEKKKILDLHEALLDIFSEGGKPYSSDFQVTPVIVFRKLRTFINRYTRMRPEERKRCVDLKDLEALAALEERSLPMRDMLSFIGDLLDSVKKADEPDQGAVLVQGLDDWAVIERKYVYVTGLSLTDMEGESAESSVLFDQELESFLKDGFRPTLAVKEEIRMQNLYRTLATFNGKQITFGYSSYDTLGFYGSNPSSFYRDILRRMTGKEPDQVREFIYGNPLQGEEGADMDETAAKPEFIFPDHTSNSSLESLISCPKRYAYERKLYMPDGQFLECDYSAWLDAASRGNFFHELARRYVTSQMLKPSYENYDSEVDEEFIRRSADEIRQDLIEKLPAAFPELADREADDLAEDAIEYFRHFQESCNLTGWRPLTAEEHFEDARLTVDTYDGKKITLSINGFIDRIDYYVRSEEKKILLRIIDYKTGRKKGKEGEDKLGKLIQYRIYRDALMDSGCVPQQEESHLPARKLLDKVTEMIKEREQIPDIGQWTVEFLEFQYVFPLDKTDLEPIHIDQGHMDGLGMTRLHAVFTDLEENHEYPDRLQLAMALGRYQKGYCAIDPQLGTLYEALYDEDTEQLKKGERESCKYCPYGDLCENRKAGRI